MTVQVALEILLRWGGAVRARRKALGLTQQQLATAAGVDQTTVSDIELGKHQPSLAKGLAIAAALETTYDALFAVGEEVA
jgi:transcriptional regulator with XRE-family HTH domain